MGFFDMDTSWYNLHSIFIRKGSLITNYVIDKIDNDDKYGQLIRRLCRYLTLDPLSTKSVDLSNKPILQKDLQDSLQVISKEGTGLIPEDKSVVYDVEKISPVCLFNGSFNQNIKVAEQCYIFVHDYHSKPRHDDIGDVYFRIDVIIPDRYDKVYDPDSDIYIKRGDAICFLIDDMLHKNQITDDKYRYLIGDTAFELVDYTKLRLAKTSDGVVYSLTYKLPIIRTRDYNGNIQRLYDF